MTGTCQPQERWMAHLHKVMMLSQLRRAHNVALANEMGREPRLIDSLVSSPCRAWRTHQTTLSSSSCEKMCSATGLARQMANSGHMKAKQVRKKVLWRQLEQTKTYMRLILDGVSLLSSESKLSNYGSATCCGAGSCLKRSGGCHLDDAEQRCVHCGCSTLQRAAAHHLAHQVLPEATPLSEIDIAAHFSHNNNKLTSSCLAAHHQAQLPAALDHDVHEVLPVWRSHLNSRCASEDSNLDVEPSRWT